MMMPEAVLRVLTVRVGEQWYALDAARVIEVLPMLAYSETPALGPDVLGLITVRDEVMPLIDLRLRFGAAQAALRLDTPLIAVRAGGGAAGLLVDAADRVVEVHSAQIRRSDASGQHAWICGVIRHEGELLLLLDPDLHSAGRPPAPGGVKCLYQAE